MKKKFIFGALRNKNFSEIAVVTVSETNTTSDNSPFRVSDVDGLAPVILTCIAGTIPNRNVLSGTVANSAKMEAGKTYLVQCTEQAYDPQYGRRFNFVNMQEMSSALEIVKIQKELGKGRVLDVNGDRPTEAEVEQFTQAFDAELVDRNGFYINDDIDPNAKSTELLAEIAKNEAIVAKLSAIAEADRTAEEKAELEKAEEYLQATV